MRKYQILMYGIPVGLLFSFVYSLYIYYSNPTWGDLASIASFIVIFPATIILTGIFQVIYLLVVKRREK